MQLPSNSPKGMNNAGGGRTYKVQRGSLRIRSDEYEVGQFHRRAKSNSWINCPLCT